MRIAVISDTHGRIDRLELALQEIEKHQPDEIWSLGDMVGYGMSPKETCQLLRQSCQLLISGNHDAAVAGNLDWFYQGVPDWLKKTLALARKELDKETLTWMKKLPANALRDNIQCYHGNAKDPVFGFYEDEKDYYWQLRSQESRLVLVGHTHRPLAVGLKDNDLVALDPGDKKTLDLTEAERWILNPGTTGLRQTEMAGVSDYDRRPGWMLLDTDQNQATWHRLPI
jgi:predicted phosphodiesterase